MSTKKMKKTVMEFRNGWISLKCVYTWLLALTTGSWLHGQCPTAIVPAPLTEDFTSQTVPIYGSRAGANHSSCWTLYPGNVTAFRTEREDNSGDEKSIIELNISSPPTC